MPRYSVVNSKTFIRQLHDVGEEVEYAGWPGSSLEPLDDVARRIKEFYEGARKRGKLLPPAPDVAQFAVQPVLTRPALVPSTETPPTPPEKPKKRRGRRPAVKEPTDG